MVQEAIFIKLVHFLTQFNKDINLAGLWEERKLGINDLNYSCIYFLILFVIESPHREPDTHVF